MEAGHGAPPFIERADGIHAGLRAFGFCSAGQDCTAARRVYAQAGIEKLNRDELPEGS